MLKNESIFKAYDIRGKYPGEINEEIVGEIISKFFTKKVPLTGSENKKVKIIIGCDARLSSPSLYKKTIETLKNLSADKIQIMPIDLSTTPEIYFLVNHHDADFGIMITASHNPKEYNGLKIVGKHAVPISGFDIKKSIS